MPARLDVDRAQARMLVMQLGYAEASRRTGVAHATLRQWGSRGGWTVREPLPPTMQPVTFGTVTRVTSQPADALSAVLHEDDRETRVSLSRATRRRAERLAKTSNPKDARNLHALTQSWAKVHGHDKEQSTTINVAVALRMDME